jgi:hypothetical protein
MIGSFLWYGIIDRMAIHLAVYNVSLPKKIYEGEYFTINVSLEMGHSRSILLMLLPYLFQAANVSQKMRH